MLFRRTRISPALTAGLLAAGLAVLPAAVAAPADAHAAGDWRWPVAGEILTPYRNGDDRYASGQHRGIDIAAPVGAVVGAATGGSVTFAGRLPDAGNCVTVRGADGVYLVSYLHLSAISVKRGATVTVGAILGAVGTTGKRSAADPHLHLGVRLKATGAYVDPLPLLGPRPAVQTPADQPEANATPVASTPPSVVKQPSDHAGSHARSHANADADANARSRSHGKRGARGRSHARDQHAGRRAPGAAQPALEDVHAHSIGDTAFAAPAVAARGSARESHAPRGRVAPPPLSVEPQSLSSRTPTPQNVASPPETGVVENPTPRGSGHGRWPLSLLLALVAAAAALLLSRRRPARGEDPADEVRQVVIKRPVANADEPERTSPPNLRVVAR